MTNKIDFLIALSALAFVAYALVGGAGLIVVGFLGVCWRVAPYRAHEPRPDFATSGGSFAVTFLQQAMDRMPVSPPPPGSLRLLADIVACLFVVLLGVHENLAAYR